MHLTLSLMIGAAAFWIFAATFDAVLDNAVMVRWDMSTAAAIHQRTTPAGLVVFSRISDVGSPTTMIVLAVVGGLVLLQQRRTMLLVTWIAALAGGGILEHILKSVVHRSRPMYGASYLTDQSFSFPSGHAMMATVGVGMVVYVLIVTRIIRGDVRALVILAGAISALLVGLSRIYLGVHYPSDVLGGFTAGGAWLGVCISVSGVVLHHRGQSLSS